MPPKHFNPTCGTVYVIQTRFLQRASARIWQEEGYSNSRPTLFPLPKSWQGNWSGQSGRRYISWSNLRCSSGTSRRQSEKKPTDILCPSYTFQFPMNRLTTSKHVCHLLLHKLTSTSWPAGRPSVCLSILLPTPRPLPSPSQPRTLGEYVFRVRACPSLACWYLWHFETQTRTSASCWNILKVAFC